MENMTVKEKMLNIIENYGVGSVEDFLFVYIDVYYKEFFTLIPRRRLYETARFA